MNIEADNEYPSKYETDVRLKDGSTVIFRPIKRDDIDLWMDFVSGLSRRSKYLRFHSLPKLTLEDANKFCNVDYKNSIAIIAETGADESRAIVGIGRYYRLSRRNAAEIAFVIADAYQGKGIGKKLLEWLASIARENDINIFEADVMAENKEMMKVLRAYGFHVTARLESGVYHVTFFINKG